MLCQLSNFKPIKGKIYVARYDKCSTLLLFITLIVYFSVDDFKNLLSRYYEFISRRPIKIIHIHFSCIEYTDKGERAHLALEAHEPMFENFVEALKEFNFDEVQIVSESPILERDALLMRDILIREGLMEPIVVEKPIEIIKKVRKKAPVAKKVPKKAAKKRKRKRKKTKRKKAKKKKQ